MSVGLEIQLMAGVKNTKGSHVQFVHVRETYGAVVLGPVKEDTHFTANEARTLAAMLDDFAERLEARDALREQTTEPSESKKKVRSVNAAPDSAAA